MRLRALLRIAGKSQRQLSADTNGTAAIEFAILLPLMLTVYIGCATVTQAISIYRKVALASHAVADLIAQGSSASNSDISNVFDAANAILTPYDTGPLATTVTSIQIDKNQKATVIWSKTRNGKTRSGDVSSKIPADLKADEGCLVWGEATYVFKPAVGYVISGDLNLAEQTFMRPRGTTCVSKS